MALADRDAVMIYIAQDKPTAAIDLDLEFGAKAENAKLRPKPYKAGRVKSTREIVVRPNYIMVYRITGDVVEVLRVLPLVPAPETARAALLPRTPGRIGASVRVQLQDRRAPGFGRPDG